MIEINVFPKTFFGLEVPEEINERVLDVVKGLDYSYDHFHILYLQILTYMNFQN